MLREARLGLWLVVAEIEGHVGVGVTLLGFFDEVVDEVGEIALVLGAGVEELAGHVDDVGVGVVARADEFEEGLPLAFA